MNDNIKTLAEQAGFMFWENEPWRPHDAIIDWSAQYDAEFKKYTELVIEKCIEIIHNSERTPKEFIQPKSSLTYAYELREHFGL